MAISTLTAKLSGERIMNCGDNPEFTCEQELCVCGKRENVSESELSDLLCAGQISKGGIVWITYKGNRRPYDVVEVLNPGTDKEEILLDIEDNLYFITSMAIDGTSWAKDVKVQLAGT